VKRGGDRRANGRPDRLILRALAATEAKRHGLIPAASRPPLRVIRTVGRRQGLRKRQVGAGPDELDPARGALMGTILGALMWLDAVALWWWFARP
jgi:hypothetical protein